MPITANSDESPRASPARQRPHVLHGRAGRDALERAYGGVGRRRPQRPGDEDAVAGDHRVDVGVEQRRARVPLGVVATNVERTAILAVERGLELRRGRRRADDADVKALGARGMERRDVDRGEREQHDEPAADDADDGLHAQCST